MKWIEAKEQLPEIDEDVIALVEDRKITQARLIIKWGKVAFRLDTQYPKSNKTCYYPGMGICCVSHWLPIVYKASIDNIQLPNGKE